MSTAIRASAVAFIVLTSATLSVAQRPPAEDDCRGHGNWEGGVFRVGGDVQPPIPLYTPEPVYPEEARDAEVEGVVSLRLMVDASGCPASTWKETGKKALLDATLAAIKRWRFQPATKDGKPVRVIITVTVAFSPSHKPEYTIINRDTP